MGIESYDRNGNLKSNSSQSACSFSGLSFIVLVLSFYLLVAIVGAVGRRRFWLRLPFAASSSLVVSAECHPASDEPDAHLKPVQWGVIQERLYDGENHCALSSRPVRKPKFGELYL